MDWLKGKKTFILVILGAIAWGLTQVNIITPAQLEMVLQLLGIGAVGTLREAIK